MTTQSVQSPFMPKQISLRLPDGLWERAEKVAEAMARRPEFDGLPLSPSRALIQAVLRGLPAIEAENGIKPPGRARRKK
jgi:hypothetical protein